MSPEKAAAEKVPLSPALFFQRGALARIFQQRSARAGRDGEATERGQDLECRRPVAVRRGLRRRRRGEGERGLLLLLLDARHTQAKTCQRAGGVG